MPRWPAELLLWRGQPRRGARRARRRVAGELDGRRAAGAGDLAGAGAQAGRRAPRSALRGPDAGNGRRVLRGSAREARPGAGAARRRQRARARAAVASTAPSGRWAPRAGWRSCSRARARRYVNMARELAVAFPEAREQFELADRVLARLLRAAAQQLRLPAAVVHARGAASAAGRADRHARRAGGARRDRAGLPAGAR